MFYYYAYSTTYHSFTFFNIFSGISDTIGMCFTRASPPTVLFRSFFKYCRCFNHDLKKFLQFGHYCHIIFFQTCQLGLFSFDISETLDWYFVSATFPTVILLGFFNLCKWYVHGLKMCISSRLISYFIQRVHFVILWHLNCIFPGCLWKHPKHLKT